MKATNVTIRVAHSASDIRVACLHMKTGFPYIHGVPIHGSSAAIRAKATMTATINVTTTRIPLVRSTTSLTNSVCIMSSRRIAASLPAKSSSGNKGRQE